LPVDDFQHAAVYSPVPDLDTGQTVRAVFKTEWRGDDGKGGEVEHVNTSLADLHFNGWVLTIDELGIFNGPEILATMAKSLSVVHDYKVHLERGPPGCGKTYMIINSFKLNGADVIMCPVRESIVDTRQRVRELHPMLGRDRAKLIVRTVDSYLTNYGHSAETNQLSGVRLLADECYMTHAGKWYAAAGLLGVTEVIVYGDDRQIPHIPRVQAPKLFLRVIADTERWTYTTRRCTAQAVACWNHLYDNKIRSVNSRIGKMVEVKSSKGMAVPRGCVILVMYQADKITARSLYAGHKVRVMTTHEAEGKTFSHVWLHKFDVRARSDKRSLFDSPEHVLVAMSRHDNEFVFVNPSTDGGLVSRWMANGRNPKLVSHASDAKTAGEGLD